EDAQRVEHVRGRGSERASAPAVVRRHVGIDVGAPPRPTEDKLLAFIRRYADDSGDRLAGLGTKDAAWWPRRSHTAHHRAEQTTLLRLLGRQVWSVYGPSVDTGGLPANGARTIYAYPDIDALIAGESHGGNKTDLPGPGARPSTARPAQGRP